MKEPTNRELLNRSLDLMQDGIRAPIEAAMRRRFNIPDGTAWIPITWKRVNPRGSAAVQPTAADTQFLLKCLKVEWRDTFIKIDRARFSELVEGHVKILIQARNTVSHNGNGSSDMSADEAREMAQSALRILEAFQAEQQVVDVRGIVDELRLRDANSLLGMTGSATRNEAQAASDPRTEVPADRLPPANPEPYQEQEAEQATEATPPPQMPAPAQPRPATAARRRSRSSGNGAVPAPVPYPWNEPSNVSKDAKYTCGMDALIRLVYDLGNREETLLTTDQHPDLVTMVRACKEHLGEPPAGVFYINEYGHVLVKAAGRTWFVGKYRKLLEFQFEGRTIGPKPDPGLRHGDPWQGPHVGILHKLAADGRDVYFRRTTRPGVNRKELLSDYADPGPVIRMARPVKQQGGRLYINEARALFTPAVTGRLIQYTYLGTVQEAEWFPEPDVMVGG